MDLPTKKSARAELSIDIRKVVGGIQPLNIGKVLSYNISCPTINPIWNFEFDVKIDFTDRSITPTSLLLQPFKFKIDLDFGKNLKFQGIIDSVSIQSNDNTSGVWSISGRDFRSLIIDGNIDPKLNLTDGMKLSNAIDKMLEPLGIKVNQAGYPKLKKLFNGFETDIKVPDISKIVISKTRPQPGAGIYEAINELLKKHGLLLAPSDDISEVSLIDIPRSVLSDYNIELRYIFRNNQTSQNNIISSTTSRNYEDVPTYCELYGRSGDSKLNFVKQNSILNLQKFNTSRLNIKNEDVFDIKELNEVINRTQDYKQKGYTKLGTNFIKVYKPFFINIKNAKNKEELDNLCSRTVADKLKNILTYNCSIDGHELLMNGTKITIVPNEFGNVIDTNAFVNEIMWIESVTYSYSEKQGAKTNLKMHLPETFVLSKGS